MSKLASTLIRVITVVVVVVIVVVGVVYFLNQSQTRKVTARFTAAVGVYPGTPVKILGVDVGEVTSVEPKGSYVQVVMEYDANHPLPLKVGAVEVANSLVSDRFIQLAPAYTGGSAAQLPDGGQIPIDRTSAPAELDDIYKALNTLSVALGPKGANKNGSLSTLLKVSAANLDGNGTPLGNSITRLSAAARTLSDGRSNLFGTVRNLQHFTKALSDSDGQVRLFNQQLATVGSDLADERSDLGAALQQLGLTLDKVNNFVKANAGKFHTDIKGLREITGVLVKQKASLNETLALAPVALANIVHSYQPNLGVIATRSNLSSLLDPGQLCAVLSAVPNLFNGTLKSVLGPLTGTIVSTCKTLLSKTPSLLDIPGLANIGKQLGSLLSGGLGIPIGGLPDPVTGSGGVGGVLGGLGISSSNARSGGSNGSGDSGGSGGTDGTGGSSGSGSSGGSGGSSGSGSSGGSDGSGSGGSGGSGGEILPILGGS